jgi:hypothetical protein
MKALEKCTKYLITKQIQDNYSIRNFWCLNGMPFLHEKGQDRKVGKPRLVTVVSAETVNKFTYVIL